MDLTLNPLDTTETTLSTVKATMQISGVIRNTIIVTQLTAGQPTAGACTTTMNTSTASTTISTAG